ncbi:MAG: hypothetical protein HY040_11265 [Planctomycetes bacterium]|nr:hypothetical protein [Planctomycetota bacterium]
MATNSAVARFGTFILLVAICFSLAGCGKSAVTKENFDKIVNDMTLEQVEDILGPGSRTGGDGALVGAQVGIDVTGGARQPSTVDYVWEGGKKSITVTFRHGKVANKRTAGF